MVLLLYYIKKTFKTIFLIDNLDKYLEYIITKYYILFPIKKMGTRNRNAKRKLIVSLTTIPNRIDKVWITVESLLRQTYRPDSIVLWLARDEFADVTIPEKLSRQVERGLTIKYCENLKSYKKFYYTVVENPDAYIVTVDDDVIYAETFLENMIKVYKRNPGCIICTRSHRILHRNGRLLSYNMWEMYDNRKEIPSVPVFQNFFVGCGGALLPVFLMKRTDLLEKDVFMDIAPTADDVWLNFNAWKAEIKVKNCDSILGNIITITSSSDNGLYEINKKKNDEQIAKVLDYMNINVDDYMERDSI